MRESYLYIAILFFLLSTSAGASTDIFDIVGKEYNINPDVIRSIASVESKFNPWALNINGESADCTTKQEAIDGLNYVYQRPYLVIVKTGTYKNVLGVKSELNCVLHTNNKYGDYERMWFNSKTSLDTFIDKYNILPIDTRKLNIESVDIGIMQINWYHHKNMVKDATKLFDPLYNVRYGTQYLKSLITQYGSIYIAIGKYHNKKNQSRQDAYREKIIEAFYKNRSS